MRDISYVGGTEIYVRNLLEYGARNSNENYQFFLIETDGHAGFPNTNFYEALEEAGVKVLVEPIMKGDDFYNPEKALTIQKIIREHDIDIVHSFLFNSDFSVLLAKYGTERVVSELKASDVYRSLLTFIPESKSLEEKIVDPIDFKWYSSKFTMFSIALERDTPEWVKRKDLIDNELEPIVTKLTDVNITSSRAVQERWQHWSKQPLPIIPCTSLGQDDLEKLDTYLQSRDELRKLFHIPEGGGRAFVTALRFEPIKGIGDLLEVFVQHQKTHPHDVLIIGGDGSLKQELTNQYGDIPNVYLPGNLDKETVLKLLTAGDVFVSPSYSEGLSMIALEAMAARKPVLSTNSYGIMDLLEGLDNGFIFEPGDNETFLKLMDKFSTLPEQELSRMGNESRTRIESHFMNETALKENIRLYE